MKSIAYFITLFAVVLLGLNAGFFYTWSFTIMQAFDLVPADHAIDAMQSINRNVRNGWFALIFFGAPAISLAALTLHLLQRHWQTAVWAAVSCGAIAVTVVTTMAYHVPWNQTLAEVVINTPGQDASSIWTTYSTQWTAANHGRAAASIVAFVAMLMAVIRRD